VFDFSDLERRIIRRHRRLRGLGTGSAALGAAAPALLAVLACAYLGWVQIPRALGLALLVAPIVLAGVLYLVGSARRPSLPRLLLRVDTLLDTDEQMATLYDLRCSGDRGPFRRRIEQTLETRTLPLRDGLPLRRHHVVPALAGVVALAASVTLLLLPAPRIVQGVPVSATAALAPGEAVPTLAVVAEPVAAPEPVEQADPGAAPSSPADDDLPEQGLEDLLEGIPEAAASQGLLSDAPGDLGELYDRQQQMMQELTDLLEEIRERLQQEEGGLTEQERRALRELANQIVDQAMRQALQDLLQEEDPSATEEALEQTLRLARSSNEEDATPSEGDVESLALDGTGDDHGDMPPWEPPMPPEEEGDPEGTSAPQSTPSGPDETEPSSEEGDESGGNATLSDEAGGEAGIQATAPPTEETPEFIPEDLAGHVGPDGEFQDFITKGVPLEPVTSDDGGTRAYRVDYERLRALLTERTIPAEGQEIARRYFESITQGGP